MAYSGSVSLVMHFGFSQPCGRLVSILATFPRFRNIIRILRIPASNKIFDHIRLVLAPYQASNWFPTTCSVFPQDAVRRYATDTKLFCFCR
jgi:hypothetical protein